MSLRPPKNYQQNGLEGRPVQEFKTSQELPTDRRGGQTGFGHLKSSRPPKNYQQNGVEGRPVLEASRVKNLPRTKSSTVWKADRF